MKHSVVVPFIVRLLGTCLYMFSVTMALSQSRTTGRITGTVQDAQGGFIPGAEVLVENSGTGEKRTAIANDAGSYIVPLVPPDSYVVTITAHGFVTVRFSNVRV